MIIPSYVDRWLDRDDGFLVLDLVLMDVILTSFFFGRFGDMDKISSMKPAYQHSLHYYTTVHMREGGRER